MQNIKNVLRRKNGRIAGVAGGLADFFGLDLSMVRLAFVLLTLFGGSGLLFYIVLWLAIPNEGWEHKTNPANATPATVAA
ncbi:MAG: PspC domain-containing protein [Chloroflexota bacterium]